MNKDKLLELSKKEDKSEFYEEILKDLEERVYYYNDNYAYVSELLKNNPYGNSNCGD